MFRGSVRAVASGGGGSTPGTNPFTWLTITSADSPYSFGSTYNGVLVDVSGGPVVVNIPTAVTASKIYAVKHWGGNLAVNSITLNSLGGDFDGPSGLGASMPLDQHMGDIEFSSNGVDWVLK
jgi:hypothetical protein